MTAAIPCKHCGSPIAFSEEDRGCEVYCSSCGRSNLIPTASAVFSADAAAELQQQVVGEETCLCGMKLEVRVEDFGGAVYCPGCGTEIQVGEMLRGGVRSAAFGRKTPAEAGTTNVGKTSPASPDQAAPPQAMRRTTLVCIVVSLAAVAAGGTLVWWSARRNSVSPTGGSAASPANASSAAPQSPESPTPPEEAAEEDDLALGDVEQLLSHADPMAALVQARLWQERLRLEDVGGEDPRWSKLHEVAESLEERLSAATEPDDREATEFRRRLDQVADGLKKGDLASAQRAIASAEELLRRHPGQLAPFQERFQILKDHLAKELELGGAARQIAELLSAADRHQAAGHVTEALEAEAEARFLALTNRLSRREAEALSGMARELCHRLRFAQGKRAVRDAERCHEAGDAPSRDREVRRALELLPGLPESQIKPLLKAVSPWTQSARTSKAEVAPSSAVGRQIRRRDCYESIWDFYANGQLDKLPAACRELDALLAENDPESLTVREPWQERARWKTLEQLAGQRETGDTRERRP